MILRIKIIIIFLLSVASVGMAQQHFIKLTNAATKKVLFLETGDKVEYVLANQSKVFKGKLKTIGTAFIVVDNDQIKLKDIQSIGKRKTPIDFGMNLLAGLGSGIVMCSLFDLTPTSCLSCHAVNSYTDQSSYEVANTLEGSVFINAGLNPTTKNPTKNSVSKWKLEIIE